MADSSAPMSMDKNSIPPEIQEQMKLVAEASVEEPAVETPLEDLDEESFDDLCPACGGPLAEGRLKPVSEDVEEYVRALLGNRKFTKTYTLYGGKLNLSFSSLSAKEATRLFEMSKKFNEASDLEEAQIKVTRMRMLFYLTQGGDQTFMPPKETCSEEELLTEYDARFSLMPDSKINLIVKSLLHFMRLQQVLVDEAFDEDFWKGAGLV